jgi:hypothetical protein
MHLLHTDAAGVSHAGHLEQGVLQADVRIKTRSRPLVPESFWQQLYAAAVILICCGLYPVVVWGIAQTVFPL